MTSPSAEARPAARDGLARFARFCVVGAVGFVVDAGLLLLALQTGRLGPVEARFLSFGVAVLVTFTLNRRWSFAVAAEGPRPTLGHFAAYLGVQGFGFLCNLTVYAGALALLPDPLGRPLPCLVLASAAALALNYLGSDLVVFRRRP